MEELSCHWQGGGALALGWPCSQSIVGLVCWEEEEEVGVPLLPVI